MKIRFTTLHFTQNGQLLSSVTNTHTLTHLNTLCVFFTETHTATYTPNAMTANCVRSLHLLPFFLGTFGVGDCFAQIMALTTTWRCREGQVCFIAFLFDFVCVVFFYHPKAEQNRNNHANSDRKKALRWQSVKVMVGSVFILVSADYMLLHCGTENPFV